jgi:hypothetical protein
MNETEIKDTPVEDEGIVIDPSDFADEAEDEEEVTSLEDTKQPDTEEVSTPTETEAKEEVIDFTPLYNELSKHIKYMDQEVTIDSLEDLVKNYQKGLDYDRKTEKLQEIENSEELTYIKSKAKENGMTPTEYIKAIKEYEIQQAKQQEEAELNEMVESGVAEHIAKKVIETNRVAKELQVEKLKLQEQQKLVEASAKKDAETNMFLETYPDVDIKTIPKEVFKEAEKSNLLTAYTKHLNSKLQQEIAQLKQNKQNEESSPIKGTTEHGGVVVEKQDDFLKGLGF